MTAAEMPALFNDEALKAQAVTARSYLLSSKDNDNLYSTNLNAQAYLDIYELKKRWGDDFNKYYEKVINAVQAHHGDVEPQTIEAVLVQAADAISASRPGARRETLEAYIKRLQELESIADSFDGVDKSYAIQAGREIRIIVKPDKISDSQMVLLGRNISEKIEKEMDYPGQIKVNLVRETRVIDYAK